MAAAAESAATGEPAKTLKPPPVRPQPVETAPQQPVGAEPPLGQSGATENERPSDLGKRRRRPERSKAPGAASSHVAAPDHDAARARRPRSGRVPPSLDAAPAEVLKTLNPAPVRLRHDEREAASSQTGAAAAAPTQRAKRARPGAKQASVRRSGELSTARSSQRSRETGATSEPVRELLPQPTAPGLPHERTRELLGSGASRERPEEAAPLKELLPAPTPQPARRSFADIVRDELLSKHPLIEQTEEERRRKQDLKKEEKRQKREATRVERENVHQQAPAPAQPVATPAQIQSTAWSALSDQERSRATDLLRSGESELAKVTEGSAYGVIVETESGLTGFLPFSRLDPMSKFRAGRHLRELRMARSAQLA